MGGLGEGVGSGMQNSPLPASILNRLEQGFFAFRPAGAAVAGEFGLAEEFTARGKFGGILLMIHTLA